MNLLNLGTFPAPLLADMNKFRNMGSNFRGTRAQVETDEIFTGVALLLGLVVAIYVLWRVAKRHERHGAYDSPRQLFQQLCKAHALDRPRRQLLKRMARWYHLTQPAQLFLEAERFDADKLGPQFAGDKAAVEQLRQLLFADVATLGNASQPAAGQRGAIGASAAHKAPVDAATVPTENAREAVQHA